MDWQLYWTVFGQVAIASPFVLILGYFIRLLWFPRRREDVSQEELDAIAEDIVDRVVYIGRDQSGDGQ